MRINTANFSRYKDIIVAQFPLGKYDFEEVRQIQDNIKHIFPDNNILSLPDDITLSIIREENPFL